MIDALLKATTRAGLNSDNIMQIAKTKYANVDLRMHADFQKRDAFIINDDLTQNLKKMMDDFNEPYIPTEIKDKLEDFAAKAIALGDDQQTLRHTNAFLKFHMGTLQINQA